MKKSFLGNKPAARALLLSIGTLTFSGILAQAPLPPKVSALAAIVVDAASGRVLFAKNADLRLHPASTTKVMTGWLLASKCRPEELLTAPTDIAKVKESSMHLMPGEQVTAGEMLYALMLRSANDGCHTVAVHVAGDETSFAKLMNERAKAVGCQNTTFVNPHGLTHPDHLTTARDLSLIAIAAMADPLFAKVVATQRHTIVRSLNQKDTLLINRDKWLKLDPRARGIKTGWTKAAGQCFVGLAQDNDMAVVTVVLKSTTWVQDQQALTNWYFDNFEQRHVLQKGDRLATVSVKNGQQSKVSAVAAKDVVAVVPKDARSLYDVSEDQLSVTAPVSKGDGLGGCRIVLYDGTVLTVPTVADHSVKERSMLAVLSAPSGVIGFAVLSGGAFLLRARSRKWARNSVRP